MARPIRIRRTGAYYHVTSRIVNKERWLSRPEFKDRIVSWMHGLADFSGVELLAWAVMDNHFHIYLHVPRIPARYLIPPEDGLQSAVGHATDTGACERPRFAMPDDEVVRLLAFLYDKKRAEAIGKVWKSQRDRGLDRLVDAHKARFCRRMYDVSEYVKTLKERISASVNRDTGHVGNVFEGRFHAGIVEGGSRAGELVSMYIDYNPLKAGLARGLAGYRWTSFAAADGGGPIADRCRLAYEKTFGRPWPEARAAILEAFADRLPDGAGPQPGTRPAVHRAKAAAYGEGRLAANGGDLGRLPQTAARLRPSQAIKLRIDVLSRGAFVARSMDFAREAIGSLPARFPRPSSSSLRRLLQIVDMEGRGAA